MGSDQNDILAGEKVEDGSLGFWAKCRACAHCWIAACNSTGLTEMIIRMARGKNVACWCGLDEPCHGDVILEIANG